MRTALTPPASTATVCVSLGGRGTRRSRRLSRRRTVAIATCRLPWRFFIRRRPRRRSSARRLIDALRGQGGRPLPYCRKERQHVRVVMTANSGIIALRMPQDLRPSWQRAGIAACFAIARNCASVGSRMSKSSLALSNLRGFTIIMVVAFHSVIAYLGSQPVVQPPFDAPPYGWRANPIIDSERWFGFDLFCAFEYVHLMQLMFFLSGLFVWPSLVRKGGKKFLLDRVLRLGVPFVIGLYLLMPVTYWPVYRVTV